jgi:hypothetical protein
MTRDREMPVYSDPIGIGHSRVAMTNLRPDPTRVSRRQSEHCT